MQGQGCGENITQQVEDSADGVWLPALITSSNHECLTSIFTFSSPFGLQARYSPQTWPGSLPAGIPEPSVLGSGSQRNMQRNQVFGSSTTGNQSISEESDNMKAGQRNCCVCKLNSVPQTTVQQFMQQCPWNSQ
eukprot:XP_011241543.1 PREDICTED: uncharacterized protein LOC102638890 [Mus musculus]